MSGGERLPDHRWHVHVSFGDIPVVLKVTSPDGQVTERVLSDPDDVDSWARLAARAAGGADDAVLRLQERAEREALRVRFGSPELLPVADTLRQVGLRGEIHPNDAAAYRHRDQVAAQAYADADYARYGHRTWLVPEPDGTCVAVLDIREALAAEGVPLTDPGLPDDERPGGPGGR